MSTSRLAWGLWALALLLVVPGPVLSFALNGAAGDVLFVVAIVAVQIGAATGGAVVASRQPGNAVGWIFLTLGAGFGLAFVANSWSEVALDPDSGPLLLGEYAAWVSTWIVMPVLFGPMLLLLFLFPTGRSLSARWRRVMWADMALLTVATLALALKPGMVGPEEHPVPNPVALPGGAGELMKAVDTLGTPTVLPAFGLAIAAMVVRFRRSRGVERQQLKWFTLFAAFAAAGLAVGVMVPQDGAVTGWAFLFAFVSLAALPVATGLAIVRHRLYDIDVVINRTLVYGALTATLAATYLGGVLLLQLALSPLTEESDLAIAGSTLAVAALFRPARSRIQYAVDRRFYRRRYDAARTLESFGVRLRDEVDLDALGGELRAVVAETMQPAHVSLWMREARQ